MLAQLNKKDIIDILIINIILKKIFPLYNKYMKMI